MVIPRLSKSRFIAGRQCMLRLWHDTYRPELATPPDEAQRAIVDLRHEIGDLARRRWPGGIQVDEEPWAVDAAVARTQALLANPSVPAIHEAAIVHGGVLTRVDALVRAGSDAWDLVEVRSSTRVDEPFDTDVALQYWILRGAGIAIRRAGVLVLDRDYVHPGGEYDLDALFRFEDLTGACEGRLDEITAGVEASHAMLAADEPPAVAIGAQCQTPYECPYRAHCRLDASAPARPIDLLPDLPADRREELQALGIASVDDIPADYPLSAQQQRVRQCLVTGAEWVSPALRDALGRVAWPLHFLDLEAMPFALPRYAGTRPWQALPFQFSCHRQSAPGADLEHSEYLARDAADPRERLARALLKTLRDRGSIVVCSSHEQQMIGALADALPGLRPDLLALRERLVDLLAIIRSYYCHPGFGGSYSIANVLPVLVPGMSHDDLEVADGQAAGRAWARMLSTDDDAERQRLQRALREYCARRSLAMFELREALKTR